MTLTTQELQRKHRGYDLFMTDSQLSKISTDKKGMILKGCFTEDLTNSAVTLAKSFPEYQEDSLLFVHHWGYVNKLTIEQLTEIVIPYLSVKLNGLLGKFEAQNKSCLIEFAKAYEFCNVRLLALRASK
jgi:hypothetical protein